MPRNMRILEVSSGGFSWVCFLVVTDDSDVVVDGAVEAADESSIESDELDAMLWGGRRGTRTRKVRCGEERRFGLDGRMALSRSVRVLLSGERVEKNRGRDVCWNWCFTRGEAIRGADSGCQVCSPHPRDSVVVGIVQREK
jgi:hypothetical protein